MNRYRVEDSARAREQARAVARWWAENRRDAPSLFTDELAAAFERLATLPSSGVPYRSARQKDVRRLLLERSRYHVYYSVDEQAARVVVRAIWHAARGRDPRLR